MALEGGSCTVSADGTVAGTGLSVPIAEWMVGPPTSSLRRYLRSSSPLRLNMAASAQTLATAIIDYLLANAEITVTVKTTDAGLQRTPNPNNPNTATQGPAGDVPLTGTIT
jgi:hypothetical protein